MSLIASLVLLLAQERPTAQGELLRVEGRTLTIQIRRDGGKTDEQAFKIPEEAAVLLDGEKAKLADLKPGRLVRLFARGDAVQKIEAPAREGASVAGELVRLEDRTLVVAVKRDDQKPQEQSLKVDKEAGVAVDGEKARLEDLKPGMAVRILLRRDVAVRIEAARKKAEDKPRPPEVKATEKSKAPEVKPAEPPKPVEKPKAVEPPKPPPPPPPPPEPPRPFPVDESIVPKGGKYPDVGGRVVSLFEDGPTLLVTVRQNNEEIPFYLPKDAAVTYVGLEKPDDRPKVGYLAYAWLKPGSSDTASIVRFGRPK